MISQNSKDYLHFNFTRIHTKTLLGFYFLENQSMSEHSKMLNFLWYQKEKIHTIKSPGLLSYLIQWAHNFEGPPEHSSSLGFGNWAMLVLTQKILGSMKGSDQRGSLTWATNQKGCIVLGKHEKFRIVSLLPGDKKIQQTHYSTLLCQNNDSAVY